MNRTRLTQDQLTEQLRAQGVPREHVAFVCVSCGTVQSLALLRRFGVPEDESENVIGYNCIGRYTGAGGHRGAHPAPPRMPALSLRRPGCDWTLGGLFRIHTLDVEMDNGKVRPSFEVASPELAQQLRALLELPASATSAEP